MTVTDEEVDVWATYNRVLSTRNFFDGSTTLDELAEKVDDFAIIIRSLSEDHELSDAVDGGWIPIRRKDGEVLDKT
jgi:hypothetical protein